MKMRKFIVIALALVLTVGLLAGCGSTSNTPSGGNQPAGNSGEFKPAALPTLPDLGGMEPNAWLISQQDQMNLCISRAASLGVPLFKEDE